MNFYLSLFLANFFYQDKCMNKENKYKHIMIELAEHLPFSIFGVSLGLILVGILTFFGILINSEHLLKEASAGLFHVFHPLHVLFSSVATTAMFWKHERNLKKAVLVGFFGSLSICGISDILFPFIGGTLLGAKMHIHICLFEHPFSVIVFALIGILSGLYIEKSIEKSTEYSHLAHVFISSAASILYLIGYGVIGWTHIMGSVFIITLISVVIPCCLSDIIFPLACLHSSCGCDHSDHS